MVVKRLCSTAEKVIYTLVKTRFACDIRKFDLEVEVKADMNLAHLCPSPECHIHSPAAERIL
jgi:hypothetical protein